MKEWIIEHWIEMIFGLISAAIISGYQRLNCKVKDKVKEQDAIKSGVKDLLRSQIIHDYNHYMEKKEIPIYALENINSTYESYHHLGGNGTVTCLIERLNKLPTPSESTERG